MAKKERREEATEKKRGKEIFLQDDREDLGGLTERADVNLNELNPRVEEAELIIDFIRLLKAQFQKGRITKTK